MRFNEPTPQQAFCDGFRECVLWQALDWNGMEEGEDNPEPMDDTYSDDDWTADAVRAMRDECLDFIEANLRDLQEAATQRGVSWDYLGHDFCLTRNGHGAGFWDKGLGALGDRLTEAARLHGTTTEYGDGGELHYG